MRPFPGMTFAPRTLYVSRRELDPLRLPQITHWQTFESFSAALAFAERWFSPGSMALVLTVPNHTEVVEITRPGVSIAALDPDFVLSGSVTLHHSGRVNSITLRASGPALIIRSPADVYLHGATIETSGDGIVMQGGGRLLTKHSNINARGRAVVVTSSGASMLAVEHSIIRAGHDALFVDGAANVTLRIEHGTVVAGSIAVNIVGAPATINVTNSMVHAEREALRVQGTLPADVTLIQNHLVAPVPLSLPSNSTVRRIGNTVDNGLSTLSDDFVAHSAVMAHATITTLEASQATLVAATIGSLTAETASFSAAAVGTLTASSATLMFGVIVSSALPPA